MKRSLRPNVVLASGSPRRTELLTWAGIQHQIVVPEVDETPQKNETPKKMVERLSRLKALAVAKKITEKNTNDATLWIIAADTTVVSSRNKNLGKPESTNEAIKMIQALQGKRHFVYTSYAIAKLVRGKTLRCLVRSVRTDVVMRKLSRAEILDYLSKGESMDKAGAYAAQGYGMVLIERITGSYTNVVGLPVAQVLQDLVRLGYKKPRK